LLKNPRYTNDPASSPVLASFWCNRLFYKGECQGKHFSLDRKGEKISLTSSPAALGDTFCCSADLTSSPCGMVSLCSDDANRFAKLSKRCGCTVSTMVLSEARGLRLFRVVRGGIGLITETGCRRHRAYRRFSYSPSNPSVSQNRLAIIRKIGGEAEAVLQKRSSRLLS